MAYELRKYIYNTAIPRAIEEDFGLPVDIIFPDSTKQTLNAHVLYDTEQIDPETGDLISVDNTWLVFASASLDQEITDGTYFKFPINPSSTTQTRGMYDGSNSGGIVNGDTIGFVRVPMTEPEQS